MDPFYLTHDINGNESDKGMIFTDSQNANDLSDPLTMIYGKNPDDGTMFAGLHAFRDADFFAANDSVDIYTGDAQLVYKIYACFIGSAENVFLTYDFHDPEDFNRFFDSMDEIRDLSMNIRQEVKPSAGDHVIGLVTHCSDESKRLFVYAVLDEVRY
jgi:sortase B